VGVTRKSRLVDRGRRYGGRDSRGGAKEGPPRSRKNIGREREAREEPSDNAEKILIGGDFRPERKQGSGQPPPKDPPDLTAEAT